MKKKELNKLTKAQAIKNLDKIYYNEQNKIRIHMVRRL